MVPIRRWAYWVMLSSLAASVGGCTTYKSYTAYEGPPRPAAETAILHCEGHCGLMIDRERGIIHDLRTISGEGIKEVTLEPGEYGLSPVYWFSQTIFSHNLATQYIPIEFQAGHTYRILQEEECELWPFGGENTADIWIKDETTDTIVAERHGLKHNCD
ncbi:MAG: hypothetical protein MN733_33060 [Nitrososphaera sp.]|nr:hypothetical protein [Nitrososphaera sp.]